MNIRVDLNYPIKDGTEVVFRSPVDCSQVTGLKVYYMGDDGNIASQEFVFADAHGNNVGQIDHLFAENVAVKVILDVTTGMAFVQNADTNAYLERRFSSLDKVNAKIGDSVVININCDNDAIRVITELRNTTDPVRTIHLKRSMMGQPLFGGEELANVFVENASATIDDVNKTVKFYSGNVQSMPIYTGPFKENTRYTFIIYGRNADALGNALNMRFRYTDGSTSTVFKAATKGKPDYYVAVSAANKTLQRIEGMHYSSSTILYYEMCGVFEGVHTADEYKVLTAIFEKGVTSGSYNWNTGLLVGNDHTEQLTPQEMILLTGENEIFTSAGVNYVEQLYVPHIDTTLTKYGSAADAGEVGYRLGNSGQGYHASYDITQGPGWYRAAVMIRSTSGIVEMGILQNKPAVGRFGQNLIFGFTGFAELVSSNFGSAAEYPRDPDARPHIFQIANHTYGEDFDIAKANGRAIRIDKVRISYPKIWTDQTDENEEYSNPINIFLDFHVTGPDVDWVENLIDPRFELNMTAHTQNHRCVPITREHPCRIDGDENVLGEFGDVVCDTYELELIDNHGFYVKEASVFEQLTALKKLWADEDADINFGHSVIRGVAPGEEDGDAVNYAQMRDYVSENVGGGTGGGATVDEVIEELTSQDLDMRGNELKNVGGLTLQTPDADGVHIVPAGYEENPASANSVPVIEFWGERGDEPAILRYIAPGTGKGDAVNKGQLDDAVGDIESALDHIIEIQNSLIGGEGA